jgi:hypothetical protein
MIKLQNYVPEYYYKESRDFQLFGRLWDALFNYELTGIKAIKDPKDLNTLKLACETVGFKSNNTYNKETLYKISNSFIDIIKYKGSLTAVQKCIDLCYNIQGVAANSDIKIDKSKLPWTIDIALEKDLNYTLLNELLDYILPTNIFVNIQKYNMSLEIKDFSIQGDDYAKGQIFESSTNIINIDGSKLSLNSGSKLTGGTLDNQVADRDDTLMIGDLRFSKVTTGKKEESDE